MSRFDGYSEDYPLAPLAEIGYLVDHHLWFGVEQ